MNNVRLYFKDQDFATVDIIEQGSAGLNFSFLEWESVFHKRDGFSLRCGVADPAHVARILDPATLYVLRNDTLQIACIQRKEFDGTSLTLEGIGVEGLLEKRFTLEKEYLPTGNNQGRNFVGAVMCDIINDNNPFAWLRADREANAVGPSIAAFTELTGNVYKYLKTLAAAYDVGFGCRYDQDTDTVLFTTFTVTPYQREIAGRVYRLSDELGNVKELTYERDTSTYCNYARVIGEDLTRIVDQSGGGERFEYSFTSRSRRKSLGDAEYAELLHDEGVQELARRRADEVFVVQPKDNQRVELGWEAVSASRSINVSALSFCTEVRETWEATYRREYTFGYRADAGEELILRLRSEVG